ncbi:MAG: 4Fe-4S dicluster domain-containing protein [Ignavibacteriales bacterium]|nr:4Fe-4S dicluster domain-containing protein [Ignavibacteriales bacterium]
MRVVETDLGEYIVQLRNEKPAHIITPAIHLRRNDVGKLFHEKLGIPYTEDIPTLTNTARKVLRDVFLTADVGIERRQLRRGRDGRHLPRHQRRQWTHGHIPAADPHCAHGHGTPPPQFRRPGSSCSRSCPARQRDKNSASTRNSFTDRSDNQQRHIIILDNGRTQLRNSALKESLYCIRCGACLNACPVFREIGGHAYNSVYSGPIGSVISAGLFGSEFVPLAQASSLCGACKDACPVDIDLPKLLTRVRAGQAPGTQDAKRISPTSRLFLQIYSRIASHPRLFTLSQKFASLGTHHPLPLQRLRPPAGLHWLGLQQGSAEICRQNIPREIYGIRTACCQRIKV